MANNKMKKQLKQQSQNKQTEFAEEFQTSKNMEQAQNSNTARQKAVNTRQQNK